MINKVLENQRKLELIEDGDRIVAGCSGGADSICLLLVLEELKKYWQFSYCAVHVEHGIRGEESLADAAFTREFCQERGIPFFLYQVDAPSLASKEGLSLEEAARKLRYDCFEQAKTAFEGNKIAVAHHADDNAETMLFHMVRGTGLKGLGGIQPKRGDIIRPLLGVTREEIEDYLESRQVPFCTDSTNAQVEYARNRIRIQVIPQLEILNVRAVEHMSLAAQQITEAYEYIAKAAWMAGRESLRVICTDDDGVITEILSCVDEESAESFLAPKRWFLEKIQPNWCIDRGIIDVMEPVLLREFLHQVLCMAAGSQKDIGTIHVENLRQLFLAETGKQTNLPYGLVGVSRYQDVRLKRADLVDKGHGSVRAEESAVEAGVNQTVLHVDDLNESELVVRVKKGYIIHAKRFDFDGDYEKIPEKTYTKWFDYDKIKSTIFLRNRQTGDYLVVNQQGNQKKLKDYLINEKVPREDRDRLMLMADGSHIMWIIGYRISEAYKVTGETKRILEVRIEKEN